MTHLNVYPLHLLILSFSITVFNHLEFILTHLTLYWQLLDNSDSDWLRFWWASGFSDKPSDSDLDLMNIFLFLCFFRIHTHIICIKKINSTSCTLKQRLAYPIDIFNTLLSSKLLRVYLIRTYFVPTISPFLIMTNTSIKIQLLLT